MTRQSTAGRARPAATDCALRAAKAAGLHFPCASRRMKQGACWSMPRAGRRWLLHRSGFAGRWPASPAVAPMGVFCESSGGRTRCLRLRVGHCAWFPAIELPKPGRHLRQCQADPQEDVHVPTPVLRHRPALPARQASQRLHFLHLDGVDPRHRDRRDGADHDHLGDERLPAGDARPHPAAWCRTPPSTGSTARLENWPQAVPSARRTRACLAPRPTSRPRPCCRAHGASGALIRGVLPEQEPKVSDLGEKMKRGQAVRPARPASSTSSWATNLRQTLGVGVGDSVNVFVSEATVTPIGAMPRAQALHGRRHLRGRRPGVRHRPGRGPHARRRSACCAWATASPACA